MCFADFQDEESESNTSDGSSNLDDDHKKPARLEESKLNALFQKQLSLAENDNATASSPSVRSFRNSRSPFYWFYSPKLSGNIYLGIYRALFTHEEQYDLASMTEIVRRKQVRLEKILNTSDAHGKLQIPATLRNGRHHFMCMIGGGHFAAMVVSVISNVVKSSKGITQRRANVIAHKSFHRYTTRRKQGGAQSANDSAKGAAHSAGASIRRHNEAALMNEVRELLLSWKDFIDSSELLFVRATGSSNSKILFGPYERQILHRNDPRLRTFPFNTRRANQTELLRSFVELTRVKVVDSEELDVDKEGEESKANKSQNPANFKKEIKQVSKKSSHEEMMEFHSSQLVSLIRRSKASAVLTYFEKNSLPISFRLQSSEPQIREKNLTSLHVAASYNSHVVVSALLSKLHADPSLVDASGRTAFQHCSGRQSRDAFRIARDELGEATWDWDAANVPSPLKRKDVEEREAQAKREADEQEVNRRQSELRQLKLKEEEQRRNGKMSERKGKTLLSSETFKSPEEKRQEEVRGMTPAAIARLERERRARAAEERMKRMQQ